MANGRIATELSLSQDVYKDSAYSGIGELSKALQNDAEWLSMMVTNASYQDSKYHLRKNYPFLYQTEGQGNVESIQKLQNANFEYKWAIMGKLKVTSQLISHGYSSTDKIGVNGSPIQAIFADRQFFRNQIVYPYGAASNQQLQVTHDPERVSTGFKYTFKLVESTVGNFLTTTSFQSGAIWSGGLPKVGIESSKGVESRSQLPSFATNMVTLTRNTYKFKGNLDKKVMKFQVKFGDAGTYTKYMDWELFLSKIYFKGALEEDLIWGRYGKNPATGDFYNFDAETGSPIPMGAGIDQQIPQSNCDTYAILTLGKWKNIIREVTDGINDEITDMHVYTGKGGMEEFDNAVKAGFVTFLGTSQTLTDTNKFIKGENSHEMQFGSYFNSYKVVDGQVITVHYHPLLHYGRRALAARKHPITGFPLTSHNFYFIDQSQVNGESNIKYVSEDGRERMKIIQGMTGMPVGYEDSTSVATDRDETSIEWMKSHGILIKRASSCFKLECTLS